MADDDPQQSSTTNAGGLYHERQQLFHCGVHALNTLFQQPWIDAAALDRVASRVKLEQGSGDSLRSWIPRLGDWDLNVLVRALRDGQGARVSQHLLANAALEADLAALGEALRRQQQQQHQQQQQQHHQQQQHQQQHQQQQHQQQHQQQQQQPGDGNAGSMQGVLVNIRSRNPLNRWLWDGRHWLALVRSPSNRLWYDCDSKQPRPVVLGDAEALLKYIRRCILEEDGQAFVVQVGNEKEDGHGS